ncbi:hypothetical protein Acr_03g0000750 [Actinidia rufa]|uniref:Late embryogenesis abundant (LEA) hydroxyproline-rich glycoprotein family n=1 Tax=Actinidia rufa TaxID=165716 RepID=A0A7J0E9X5_9ERIC|nr:hypothetical protein Acr_03g0000750 [Actinidia rufa]
MAEKEQQAYHPAAANGYSRNDAETGGVDSKELRRQKQKKWALYIIAFVIFQTGIIVLFTFTVMKFRTPKFRVRHSKSFDTFDVQPATPSFNMRMNAQFGVKNTNFGPFKYGNTTVTFYYKGIEVGSTTVRKVESQFPIYQESECPCRLSHANNSSQQYGFEKRFKFWNFASHEPSKNEREGRDYVHIQEEENC